MMTKTRKLVALTLVFALVALLGAPAQALARGAMNGANDVTAQYDPDQDSGNGDTDRLRTPEYDQDPDQTRDQIRQHLVDDPELTLLVAEVDTVLASETVDEATVQPLMNRLFLHLSTMLAANNGDFNDDVMTLFRMMYQLRERLMEQTQHQLQLQLNEECTCHCPCGCCLVP